MLDIVSSAMCLPVAETYVDKSYSWLNETAISYVTVVLGKMTYGLYTNLRLDSSL